MPEHLELSPAWQDIRHQLRRAVGDSTYDIWLAALEVANWDGSVLVLQGKPGTEGWVADRFGRVLERCARQRLGNNVKVAFAGDAATLARHALASAANTQPQQKLERFNPRYTFDQFIIGDGNRLAHAAALAVAELPGQAYNPLFLHAPPGLGKTHLLHAIGNYVQAFGDGAGVRYTTAEAFTNQFITALGSRSVDRFKRAYRDADVLLIDDVQFLASKARTEEEFFHTFNAVYETGRQLVVTCDRLPRQLVSIEERLRERFESGLVAVIQPPDFATRVAILRKRAALDRIWIEDDAVLESIAARVTDNVRVLEGALIRIVAYNSLTQLPIDVELAQTVLNEIRPRPQTASLSIADIQRVVAGHYGLAVTDLVSSSRAARVSWPRQLAIHLARQLTSASLNAIGEAFGGRNHATVLHACKRVEERVGSDQHAVDELEELIAAITSSDTDRSH